MKIAVVCPRKLNIFSSKYTYTLESILFKLLANRGHQIDFFTKIDSFDMFNAIKNINSKDIKDFEKVDYDVLFVVNGKWGNILSCTYSQEAYNIISLWDKNIIYSQNDPDNWLIYDTDRFYKWESKEEYIKKLITTPEKIFEKIKNIHVWCNAYHTDLYRQKQPKSFTFYDKDFFKFSFVDLGKLECYNLKRINSKKHNNKYIYVGNKRPGRKKSFLKLLPNDKSTDVFTNNPWEEFKYNFNNKILYSTLQEKYNDYFATVQPYESRYMKLSSYTLRPYQTIMSGSFCFIDKDIFAKKEEFSITGNIKDHDEYDNFLLVDNNHDLSFIKENRNKIIDYLQEKLISSLNLDKDMEFIENKIIEAINDNN